MSASTLGYARVNDAVTEPDMQSRVKKYAEKK